LIKIKLKYMPFSSHPINSELTALAEELKGRAHELTLRTASREAGTHDENELRLCQRIHEEIGNIVQPLNLPTESAIASAQKRLTFLEEYPDSAGRHDDIYRTLRSAA
jgi:hypothetical protein